MTGAYGRTLHVWTFLEKLFLQHGPDIKSLLRLEEDLIIWFVRCSAYLEVSPLPPEAQEGLPAPLEMPRGRALARRTPGPSEVGGTQSHGVN